jgi:NADPH-dependent F420 reductase
MTVLAIIGGTGKQGTALAARFAKAGTPVILGSRDAQRGADAARALNARLGLDSVQGTSNRQAAAQGDVVLLSVPYDGMPPILQDLLEAVRDKIVVNLASALDPEKKTRARVPVAGSITAEIQQFFGPQARVVAAFQHISPEKLESEDVRIDSDVLVCGGDRDAREQVIALIRQAGMDAFDGGVLANAVAIETFTAVLIAINVKYKIKGAGIRLTGVPRGT